MQSRILRTIVLLLCLTTFVSPAFAAPRHRPSKAKAKVTVTAIRKAKAAVREAVEKSLPRTMMDEDGNLAPVVHAASAIVFDPDTQEVLYNFNAEEQRSIASITKVMTATVALESEPDLNEMVTIEPSDVKAASHTYLRARDRVTVDNLLHLLLIGSDNAAARALARTSPYGADGFIVRMNEKALELGLDHTRYADPSGLLAANLSTVYDMAQLMTVTAQDSYIPIVMRLANYTFRVAKRVIVVSTTDHLLAHPDIAPSVLAAKTGYIHESGFCLATLLQVSDVQRVAIVVFGAVSNAARFEEVQNLYRWLLARSNVLLHISMDGLDFIRQREGFHSAPYKDSGGWAVGYGSHYWNGQVVTRSYPGPVSQEDADAMLPAQVERFERVVKQEVVAPLQQHEFDALVSVAYNLGRVNTTIRQAYALGRLPSMRDFLSTATVKNRRFKPLVNRRVDEFNAFVQLVDNK